MLTIIPYQELPGNYNLVILRRGDAQHYTIPRTTRELQLKCKNIIGSKDYTIPRTTRELQPGGYAVVTLYNYTIPRTTRELQRR